MQIFASQGVRLAFLVTSLTLGACADQPITSPAGRPDVVSSAAGDVVPTVDGDTTRVTFTIAREENYYFESTGYVQVHGTFACSRALGQQFDLFVKVEQKRPARGSAVSYLRQPVTCTTTAAQPWVAVIPPGSNSLEAGRALVTVFNAFQIPGSMVPSTASAYVKLALSEAS
jgi:hypothetical protein